MAELSESKPIEIFLTVCEGKTLLVWKGSPLLRAIPVINEAITDLGFVATYPVDANRFYAARTDIEEIARLLAAKSFVVSIVRAEEND